MDPVFFGLHRIKLGFIILLCLWVSVIIMIVLAFYTDLIAGLLLTPYIVWGSYAGALNFSIIQLNRRIPKKFEVSLRIAKVLSVGL